MTFVGNQFRADEQIDKALSDVGASKFYRDVKSAEMLLGRAKEMLSPAGGERRVVWRDVVSRSLTNERWPWLPPKGLEELRKLAEGSGRWKYSEEGYIERGPFPKPRTRVLAGQRDYKEETGTAVLEVLAKDAGPHGRDHYSLEAGVSAVSPTLPGMISDGGVELLKERDTRPARSEMKHDEHKILRGVYPVLQIARHQGTGEAGWEVVSAL
jgi:hypothetical protein